MGKKRGSERLMSSKYEDINAKVYTRFDKAVGGAQLEAFVIAHSGQIIGRVVLKHGNQVTAFVQVWGLPMVSGYARGHGYDRATAAIQSAGSKYLDDAHFGEDLKRFMNTPKGSLVDQISTIRDDGQRWDDQLRQAGFDVQHVLG